MFGFTEGAFICISVCISEFQAQEVPDSAVSNSSRLGQSSEVQNRLLRRCGKDPQSPGLANQSDETCPCVLREAIVSQLNCEKVSIMQISLKQCRLITEKKNVETRSRKKSKLEI